MNSAHTVLIRPIVSENSYDDMSRGKYTFEVARDANKREIKSAVEEIFNVTVRKTNTSWVKAKTKRVRYIPGRTRTWKKAVVTLKEGDSIEVFGNQASE